MRADPIADCLRSEAVAEGEGLHVDHHMYIDESKSHGYLMVGAVIKGSSTHEARRALNAMLLPGQERIHFSSESDARRKEALEQMSTLAMPSLLVHAQGSARERDSRRRCLTTLVDFAGRDGISQVCIELNDSQQQLDRDVAFGLVRSDLQRRPVSFRWLRASQQPLLWIPDGFAWAYARGGTWRQRVRAMLTVHNV